MRSLWQRITLPPPVRRLTRPSPLVRTTSRSLLLVKALDLATPARAPRSPNVAPGRLRVLHMPPDALQEATVPLPPHIAPSPVGAEPTGDAPAALRHGTSNTGHSPNAAQERSADQPDDARSRLQRGRHSDICSGGPDLGYNRCETTSGLRGRM